MTDAVLVLGGTGKTARHLAPLLREAGEPVRTAARSGADVVFDWGDPSTHGPALDGAGRMYLVPPAFDLGFAPVVIAFLDRAQAAGVRHVTLLSAAGIEHAPPETALRAVELDLAARSGLTHTVLRPAWFMQNFSEGSFAPMVADGVLPLPAGDGAEAFVDTRDIAAAAASTLRDPAAHDGAAYVLSGPEALTFTEVAAVLSGATGREVRYAPTTTAEFVGAMTGAGLPAAYAGMLAGLLAMISSGGGTPPTTGVADATGRAPRGFADWAADAARAGAWSGVPA
jgi:uncharacterized protein YbjT (DUF2867 family)